MESLIGTDIADFFFALNLSVYIIDYLYLRYILLLDVLIDIMPCFYSVFNQLG